MNAYPHMCRSGHVEIGHADSEHEQCPLCRANAREALLMEALQFLVDASQGPPLAGTEERWVAAMGVARRAIDVCKADK